MLKMSTSQKRNVFIFLFTALFGLISWLYFYLNFFNFFVLKEGQFIIDHKNKLIVVSERHLESSIPKKGIKINADKYTFSNYQSILSNDIMYRVFFKVDTFSVVLINQPVLALHIVDYSKNEEKQKIRWELKQPDQIEQTGFGLIYKKLPLLDSADLEIRFFIDSFYSKPVEITIWKESFSSIDLVKKAEETVSLSMPNSQNVIHLFINGALDGVYAIKER